MALKPPIRTCAVTVASLAVSYLFPCNLFAWSVTGHKVVGQIAQDLLQKAAQRGDLNAQSTLARLQSLLGSNYSLAEIAPCADEIRPFNDGNGQTQPQTEQIQCGGLQLPMAPGSEPWHFIDIPTTAPAIAQSVAQYCGGNNCVVGQIKVNLGILQNSASSVQEKQLALMYLTHFVGDEHQPLHCTTELTSGIDDRGGNAKMVKFNGRSVNLHALWDRLIQINDNVNDPIAISQQLESQLPDDTSPWLRQDFVTEAALESFEIAQQTIYPSYYEAQAAVAQTPLRKELAGDLHEDVQSVQPAVVLPPSYQSDMLPIVQNRLKIAGVRLAFLLEQAFTPGAYAPTYPNFEKRPHWQYSVDLPVIP